MPRQADEDLLAELDSLGDQLAATSKPTATKKGAAAKANTDDEDALAGLEDLVKAKPATSRPATPRLSSSTTSATNKSPKRTAEYTPATTSQGSSERNSSEDRARVSQTQARASGEGSRSFHTAQTPQAEEAKAQQGGGWWGSWGSIASAAVKQAETLAKNIQTNEEAQKWVTQIRQNANLENLQHLGTDLRSKGLSSFTSIISHIAPPISAHERLQIHTTHDILNYPSLDPLIYNTFSRVMSQVEGGDLLVIQRGTESRGRSSSDLQGYRGTVLGTGTAAWSDGPWWREEGRKRSLGTVPGLKEGTRLARVQAESYAKEFFDTKGGVEEAAKRATETLSESNPVRSSDIFLAIQAVSYAVEKDLFAEDSQSAAKAQEAGVATPSESDEVVVFAIYLHDPLHSISFRGLSQPFPQKWAEWLDAEPTVEGALPDSILEIIQSGGVDPREWVAEWMEELLSTAVGVVAQQYVAKRMGVGEGGIGRGKQRAEEDESAISGEAARAI
ncbi:hypothetical protein CB0940_06863 [Cercospora beticola]|uniref:Maintenance of telomere capping protein 1 n=1 Tax=Cercospora beticola TaxID=122368 RepID=A0A2G5HA35_CERBT|nr:hypothetical protein CB0940_06863 [Cercospora beticola]PIA89092.1 hypothetical protein CB0940_06863 [Cercospora beticola]WPB02779.1 hypothetical protein RHO25_007415 [Cercospora beticola]